VDTYTNICCNLPSPGTCNCKGVIIVVTKCISCRIINLTLFVILQTMYNIIIATDSRGRFLERYLASTKPFWHRWQVCTIMKPGANLKVLKEEIQKHLHPEKQNIIMLAGGICNLTSKITHRGGVEITYTSTDKVQNITSTLHDISDELSHSNTIVKIATIPPVSLDKYSTFQKSKHRLSDSIFSTDTVQQQQRDLEADITQINNTITAINQHNGVRTVNWHRDLLRTSIKKRGWNGQSRKSVTKYTYGKLYDGVHAVEELSTNWFRILCESVVADIEERIENVRERSVDDVVAENEEKDEEDETWDFKR
jgi:hypothetical protein